MKVSIGSDHRGIDARHQVAHILDTLGHAVDDCGTDSTGSVDYPDIAAQVAEKVSSGVSDRGILICGTGIGMSLAANKFRGVRAAVCQDELFAEISRRHNDLNILCLSGDTISQNALPRIIEIWMKTPFDGGRHQVRVDKIKALEDRNFKPNN